MFMELKSGDSAIASRLGSLQYPVLLLFILMVLGGRAMAQGAALPDDGTHEGRSRDDEAVPTRIDRQGAPLIQAQQEPYSVFIGKDAGAGTNTANQNSGRFNTAVGFGAFTSNHTGDASVAIGMEALHSNLTGTRNTAVGYRAMFLDKTGSNNTAVGYRAMFFARSGDNNTAFGYGALHGGWYKHKDTVSFSGNGNTAIGMQALYNLQSGTQNVAVGEYAMGGSQADGAPNTASNNIAVGRYALRFINTGNSNVAIGHHALLNLGAGSNNIAIGYLAGSELKNSASNNILIGNSATVADPSGSNQMNIGNVIYGSLTTGDIGIGTSQPRAKLDVNGYVRLAAYGAAPARCSANNAGSLALTKGYTLCSCNGTEWTYADSTGGACNWMR